MSPAARILSRLVAHQVGRDREKPGSFAHEFALARGPEKGFRSDLFGPVAITESSRQVADERLVVFAKESIQIGHWAWAWGWAAGFGLRARAGALGSGWGLARAGARA